MQRVEDEGEYRRPGDDGEERVEDLIERVAEHRRGHELEAAAVELRVHGGLAYREVRALATATRGARQHLAARGGGGGGRGVTRHEGRIVQAVEEGEERALLGGAEG